MAQQRKRKAGEGAGADVDHHTQAARQVVEAGASPSPVGNGAKSHEIHASIATLMRLFGEAQGKVA